MARLSSTRRLYDARWRAESKTFLKRHPLCEFCLVRGKHVKARIVDHRIPHRRDAALFWSKANWSALCKPCHDGAKQRQESTGRVLGCDEQGVPLDPDLRSRWTSRLPPSIVAKRISDEGGG